MAKDTYDRVQIVLHWLTAVVVVGLFALGLYIGTLDYYDPLYRTLPALHKSIGFLLIFAIVFRLMWRFRRGLPQPLPNHQPWEKWLAKAAHLFLYVAILSMFFSGYFITTAEGQPLEVLGFISIPATITSVDSLEHWVEEVHELTAFAIIGVAAFHGLAALKHHFWDKDRTLLRMLGR